MTNLVCPECKGEILMIDCKYWRESWGKSFAGRCCAPNNTKTSASDNKWCMTPQICPYLLNQSYVDKSQMTKMTAEMFGANTPIVPDETLDEWLKDEPVKKMTKKELIQKQIEELQTALKLLEIEENRRTPCEKAYRDAYGEFPITDSMSGGDGDYIAWNAFQKGWESSRVYHNKYFVIANSKQEEVKKLQEKDWTYKITDEHGESNPYKQGLNMIKEDKETEELMTSKGYEKNSAGVWEPKNTLWRRFYDEKWSDSACDEFCEMVEQWLYDNTITVEEDYHTVTLKLRKGMLRSEK